MTPDDILSHRLHHQRVTGAPFERPEEMVRLLCGVQSQDYAGARWSVGQRTRGCTDGDVARACDEGKILRTHILRPTWHFVPPADIRWMLALTSPHVHALNAYMYRKLELDEAIFARSHALFAGALAGHKHLTRPELAAALARAGIVADKMRLSYIVMHAELEGLICSGASRGKQQTYALLVERAPQARMLAGDEALAELTRRFFLGHGPATSRDYAWWSGFTLAEARRGLELVRRELGNETVDGEAYWFAPTLPPAAPLPDAAFLMPEYDEIHLPYRHINFADLLWAVERDTWTDFFYRPILVGGKRAGTWRRTVNKDAVLLEAHLFAALDAAQWWLLEDAAARYGRFMGLPVTVQSFP
jgi:hypothetical protein